MSDPTSAEEAQAADAMLDAQIDEYLAAKEDYAARGGYTSRLTFGDLQRYEQRMRESDDTEPDREPPEEDREAHR